MKKFIIFVLLLAALLFGAKTYMEYRYSRLLNQQTSLLSSSASISHEDVKLDWNGSVLINNLQVKPVQSKLTLYAGQVRVSSPFSYMTVLDLHSLEKGELKQVFDITANRMIIDGPALSASDENSDCRSLEDMFVFSAIDMVPLRATASFKVDASNPETLVVRYDALDQLANYRGRVVVDKSNIRDVMVSRAGLNINRLSVRARFDKDKADQLMQYCSSIFDVDKDVFVNQVIASPRFSTNSFGVDLGQQARFGIAAFLRGDGEIFAQFGRFGKPGNLEIGNTKDSIWRSLELDIDDVPIPLGLPDVAVPEIEITAEEIAALAQPSAPQRVYVDRSIDEALNFVGRKVRIQRTEGRKPIQGELIGQSPAGVMVMVLHRRGEITMTVSLEDIEGFSVRQN